MTPTVFWHPFHGAARPIPNGKDSRKGRYALYVTNEILAEYEEMIARMASAEVATNVIRMIMDSRHVEFIDTYYHWNLITAAPDDNKFVDCAFAAGATYIVSDDSHFNGLHDITFPQLLVLRLKKFPLTVPEHKLSEIKKIVEK